jgi:hypothetical protein
MVCQWTHVRRRPRGRSRLQNTGTLHPSARQSSTCTTTRAVQCSAVQTALRLAKTHMMVAAWSDRCMPTAMLGAVFSLHANCHARCAAHPGGYGLDGHGSARGVLRIAPVSLPSRSSCGSVAKCGSASGVLSFHEDMTYCSAASAGDELFITFHCREPVVAQ